MNREIIAKLLKSTNPDDNILGLELQYQAFKRGYTNWYKRSKYNKEFVKRILIVMQCNAEKYDPAGVYVTINNIKISDWFKTRLEEDSKDNML